MAADSTSGISYYLQLQADQQDNLGELRQWPNLKVAAVDDVLWIKGFTEQQKSHAAVAVLPFSKLYCERNGRLYPDGSALPEQATPAGLWTDIARAIPVVLPSLNHNYFGLNQTINTTVVPSNSAVEASAILVDCTQVLH